MTWLDIVLGILLVGVAVLEMCRGFGRSVLDALALYGALWLSDAAMHYVESIAFHPNTPFSHGWTFGLLFLTFGTLGILVSRFVYHATLIHTGMFEGLFGAIAGLAVGMILAHGMMRVVVLSDTVDHAGVRLVSESFLGSEMLSFTTYHSVLATLTDATNTHRSLPNVSG